MRKRKEKNDVGFATSFFLEPHSAKSETGCGQGERGEVGRSQIRYSQECAFCLVIIQGDTRVVLPAVLGLVLDGEAAASDS